MPTTLIHFVCFNLSIAQKTSSLVLFFTDQKKKKHQKTPKNTQKTKRPKNNDIIGLNRTTFVAYLKHHFISFEIPYTVK